MKRKLWKIVMEKYIVLDTETTNSLDDPIVYDIGFAVVDGNGKIYEKQSYVIADVFLDCDLMSYAYFAEKIPQYWNDIKNGNRKLRRFSTVYFILRDVCEQYGVKKIFAHNARFDYLSLTTTQRYLTGSKYRFFLPYGIEVCDTLKMSREVLGNSADYRSFCEKNGYTYGKDNKNLRFTAEVIYKFLTNDVNFEESHTGLEDVLIEKEILRYCLDVNPEIEAKLWK